MIPIQPILAILPVGGVVRYFRRLRSKLWDRIIAGIQFAAATVFIMQRSLANRLAVLAEVGRGADLFFYATIPGLAFASEAATLDGQLQRPIMKRIPDTASSSIPLATTTLVKAS